MRAEIITIGDELLIGQVVDTNSAWMAERLNEVGIELYQITSVHDDRQHILAAIDEAFSRVDIVLTTGGLGPTKDDITKQVLCEYFGTTLTEDASVREHIHALYQSRPDVLNRLTATQWLVPQSATILPNRVGSAPIMVFQSDSRFSTPDSQPAISDSRFSTPDSQSAILIALPGVPYEMQIAMTEQVLPFIQSHIKCQTTIHGQLPTIIHRTLLLYGIPESTLALRIEEWESALPNTMHLAYLPKDGMIRLRLSTYGEATIEELNRQIDALLPLIAEYLIATEDLPLEAILGNLLKERHQTIATAESCTGGRLAAALNAQPGSSVFYMGSVIAYDNSVKTHLLGVSSATLKTDGAVSESTVLQMAEGVRRLLHTDYAIATSGIAGPSGGTTDKPVGTVWIAWATPEGTFAKRFSFGIAREREQITQRAVTAALAHLIIRLSTTNH